MARRTDIIAALTARFQDVEGLVTVARGRDLDEEPFDRDEIPALNIDDGSADNSPDVSLERHAMKVTLELVMFNGATNDDVEAMLQKLLDAVALDSRWKDDSGTPLAAGTTFSGHAIGRKTTGDFVLRGTIDLVINYSMPRWQI